VHLAALAQAVGTGRFDAQEHAEEIRRAHQAQQLRVVGQVQAGLGEEPERVVVRFLPPDDLRQQFLDPGLVADEVVVHEEQGAAATGGV